MLFRAGWLLRILPMMVVLFLRLDKDLHISASIIDAVPDF